MPPEGDRLAACYCYLPTGLIDMARKTKIDALKTRQLLIDTAIVEFAARGVSCTTLTDIAQAAGVTRGAVYWHFASKEALFNEIWKQQIPVREMVAPLLPAHIKQDPLRLLRETLILSLQYVACNPRWRALLQILYRKCEFTGEMISEEEIRKQIGFNREAMRNMLRQCVESGQVVETINTEMVLIIFYACLSGIIKNWLSQVDGLDLYNQAEEIVDNMLAMLPRREPYSDIKPAVESYPPALSPL